MIVRTSNTDPPVSDGADDGRRLSVEERRSRKMQALGLHRQGLAPRDIARQVGLSVGTIRALINVGHYSPPAPAGRKQGSARRLSPEQEHEVRVFMRRQSPIRSSKTGRLWTRAAVGDFLTAVLPKNSKGSYEKTWTVDLTRRGIDRYLSRWGISIDGAAKVPSLRASRSIRNWLTANEDLVQEQEAARHTNRIWLNGPKVLDTATEWHPAHANLSSKKVHLLSAETSNGTLHWRLFDGPVSSATQIAFLKLLVQCFRRVVLIRMRSPIYHSPEILQYIETQSEWIALLPPRQDGNGAST